jgi:SAM-dependent methyltransferase
LSQADRDKWDRRYREGSYLARVNPTQLLADWLPRLPVGRALDVACGAGRNALFLAEAGYEVDAVDISAIALERARQSAAERDVEVNWLVTDLEEAPLPAHRYDVILMVRYVNHALVPKLLELLNDGGHFVCEQHLVTDDDVAGPSSPAFRLQPGELKDLAGDTRVVHYHEGLVADPDGRQVALAQLIARR